MCASYQLAPDGVESQNKIAVIQVNDIQIDSFTFQ